MSEVGTVLLSTLLFGAGVLLCGTGFRASHPALFFVLGAVGYALIVASIETFLRAVGIDGVATLFSGRRARIRAVIVLVLGAPLLLALLFALLLTRESGDSWSFAVLGVILVVVVTMGAHIPVFWRR